MKHFIKTMVVVIGLSLALQGCYPNGPEYIDDADVVITYVKGNYDFKSKSTYALPDRIVKITGNLTEGDDPIFIPDAAADPILTRIRLNMQNLGWQEVGLDENPDLLLAPASWETKTLTYYYDYWYWWWGGGYPGWIYPPSYPPTVVSGFSTGTLIMGLIDPTVLSADGNTIVQWTGAINGILTETYNATRINNALDKTFSQSPYLNTK